MNQSLGKEKHSFLYRAIVSFVLITFISGLIIPSGASAQSIANTLGLPAVGSMVTPTPAFMPAMMRGVILHPEDALKFDFVIEKGDSGLAGEAFNAEATKLIKYFLAALTVPEQEMWVNLSPYEKDRIIPGNFGQTEMGRDLLAQDYLLKQITASLMYPEKELGDAFWKRVHEKAQEKFGSVDIPTNTFNKIWIVPSEASVYENQKGAFVVKSHLKVMMDEDYLALEANKNSTKHGLGDVRKDDLVVISGVQSQVIKEVLIPEIEKEVNEGKTFANLRQIYNAVILASWYKKALKESLLGKIYVDQAKTKGVEQQDPSTNERIYKQYVEAFEKGVYNYIKEEYDPTTQAIIPRKYFSGGVKLDMASLATVPAIQAPRTIDNAELVGVAITGINSDGAMLHADFVDQSVELSVGLGEARRKLNAIEGMRGETKTGAISKDKDIVINTDGLFQRVTIDEATGKARMAMFLLIPGPNGQVREQSVGRPVLFNIGEDVTFGRSMAEFPDELKSNRTISGRHYILRFTPSTTVTGWYTYNIEFLKTAAEIAAAQKANAEAVIGQNNLSALNMAIVNRNSDFMRKDISDNGVEDENADQGLDLGPKQAIGFIDYIYDLSSGEILGRESLQLNKGPQRGKLRVNVFKDGSYDAVRTHINIDLAIRPDAAMTVDDMSSSLGRIQQMNKDELNTFEQELKSSLARGDISAPYDTLANSVLNNLIPMARKRLERQSDAAMLESDNLRGVREAYDNFQMHALNLLKQERSPQVWKRLGDIEAPLEALYEQVRQSPRQDELAQKALRRILDTDRQLLRLLKTNNGDSITGFDRAMTATGDLVLTKGLLDQLGDRDGSAVIVLADGNEVNMYGITSITYQDASGNTVTSPVTAGNFSNDVLRLKGVSKISIEYNSESLRKQGAADLARAASAADAERALQKGFRRDIDRAMLERALQLRVQLADMAIQAKQLRESVATQSPEVKVFANRIGEISQELDQAMLNGKGPSNTVILLAVSGLVLTIIATFAKDVQQALNENRKVEISEEMQSGANRLEILMTIAVWQYAKEFTVNDIKQRLRNAENTADIQIERELDLLSDQKILLKTNKGWMRVATVDVQKVKDDQAMLTLDSNKIVEDNDPFLIAVKNFRSELAKTFVVGNFSAEQLRAIDKVLAPARTISDVQNMFNVIDEVHSYLALNIFDAKSDLSRSEIEELRMNAKDYDQLRILERDLANAFMDFVSQNFVSSDVRNVVSADQALLASEEKYIIRQLGQNVLQGTFTTETVRNMLDSLPFANREIQGRVSTTRTNNVLENLLAHNYIARVSYDTWRKNDSKDFASLGEDWNKGGIDMNPNILNMNTQKDGSGVVVPVPAVPAGDWSNVGGFVPNIINVTPITNLPLLLGIAEPSPGPQEVSFKDDVKAREVEVL